MKPILILFALEFVLASGSPAQTYSWRQSERALALLNGANVVWQIVADPAQGKPYFHPLATPGGIVLTDLRPQDHPWHRGLWFSWKYINSLNYWEEDPLTHKSDAATELVESKFEPRQDGSAELKFSLSYHPWNAPAVLTEQRTIEISAPANGRYEINWTSEFTAVTNVSLTRTPPPGESDGKPWGGYAGLSLRLNKAMCGWTFSNSSGVTGATALHGKPTSWLKFSAGTNLPAVTIFDDRQNSLHPSPWYVNQEMPFFSPALLFTKSLTLSPGEKLVLHYKILITDRDVQDKVLQ